MSALPDINTENVAFIAYWNATNHGVNTIDPSEVTSWSRIESTTAYDNGFQGTFNPTTRSGTTHHWRVKNDGWFVTWIERGENYPGETNSDGANAKGHYTTVHNWGSTSADPGRFDLHSLERAINGLQSELSNSGSITYNRDDVGTYSYEYPDAAAATALSVTAAYGNHESATFQYTDDTNVLYATASAGINHMNPGAGSNSYVQFENVTVARATGEDSRQYRFTAIDAIGQGLLNGPGQGHTVEAQTSYSQYSNRATATAFLIWE